jgi:nicotinate-nucleotide--dimethylbenzimidazole phosphoribosyltransferase
MERFVNFSQIRPVADEALEGRIRRRLDSLTKPPGSLGRLEELALQVGLIQGSEEPVVRDPAMAIFCADHGIVEEGVSPYPAEVTRQMVANFRAGGAAITVLCRHYGIRPVIVDMGVGKPTRNFARERAMTREQAEGAIEEGARYAEAGDVLGAGEMGIGNSTAAAALLSAFSGLDPVETCGRGTGLDDAGVAHKVEVIRGALRLHRIDVTDPVGVLAAVGGFEIAGMVGLILGAARLRRVIVLDGFISCSAALVARGIAPAALDYMVFSHRSAERGHRKMLEFLGARPLFDLDMRLGEGTGAALGINLVQAAVKIYREMATFEGAGVSTGG